MWVIIEIFIPVVTYSRTHSRFTRRVLKDITKRGTHYNIIAYGRRSTTKTVYTYEIVINHTYIWRGARVCRLHESGATVKRMAKRQSNLPAAWFPPTKKIASNVVTSTERDRGGQSELDVSQLNSGITTDHNSSLCYGTSLSILACNNFKAIRGIARWWIFMNINEHPHFYTPISATATFLSRPFNAYITWCHHALLRMVQFCSSS